MQVASPPSVEFQDWGSKKSPRNDKINVEFGWQALRQVWLAYGLLNMKRYVKLTEWLSYDGLGQAGPDLSSDRLYAISDVGCQT